MAGDTPSFDSILRWMNVAIGLAVVALIADAIDAVCYFRFARANGFRWFQPMPWALMWQYLSSFPGNILTALGIVPYLLILAGCKFVLRCELDSDEEEFEYEESDWED